MGIFFLFATIAASELFVSPKIITASGFIFSQIKSNLTKILAMVFIEFFDFELKK